MVGGDGPWDRETYCSESIPTPKYHFLPGLNYQTTRLPLGNLFTRRYPLPRIWRPGGQGQLTDIRYLIVLSAIDLAHYL